MAAATPPLPRSHARRLRDIWRSAGWPCRDPIEAGLLAAGLIQSEHHPGGHETLRLTEAGVHALAASHAHNRSTLGAHEALVERVAREMARAGRIVWRGLALRAPPPERPEASGAEPAARWSIAMPDVYSIRHTTREDWVEPIAHEIKVSRADLLGDLRNPAKRAAYLALAGECWYVLREGIAAPEEVPPECGVMFASAQALSVARPAPRRALRLPFAVWMALARAAPIPGLDDDAQGLLGDASTGDPGGCIP